MLDSVMGINILEISVQLPNKRAQLLNKGLAAPTPEPMLFMFSVRSVSKY